MSKILIVEDEIILRDAFTILLDAQNKYEIDVAANGQEALEQCKKTTYDLILLDLMMPILDGVGFLRKAALLETAPETKVIIMSNLSSGDILAEALKLGALRNEVKSNLAPGDIVAIVDAALAVSKT